VGSGQGRGAQTSRGRWRRGIPRLTGHVGARTIVGAVGLFARLGSLLSPGARPEDPLIGRLSEMPVPLSEAGSLVDGLEHEESMSGLTTKLSRGDRELGGLAQYQLRFSLPSETGAALVLEGKPSLQWVTQVVVLLSDADAAARWLTTKTRRFEDWEGREVDGFLYREIDLDHTLTGLGDEAEVVVAHNESEGIPRFQFVDTYVNFRRGRLFAGVAGSTHKELDIRSQLTELAGAFLSRMELITAEARVMSDS
jgi:hypothetical protein